MTHQTCRLCGDYVNLSSIEPTNTLIPILFVYHTYQTVLMIMASHQTFSGQFKHLTGQTKFDQSDILYTI